jgi:trigger factor
MSNYVVSRLPKSKIKVEMHISKEELETAYKKALNRITQETHLKGFRRGKAPQEMVEGAVGQEKIYEEALNRELPRQLETALKAEAEKNKDDRFIVLDYPKFNLANEWKPGEDLDVTAECTLYPKVAIDKLEKELKIKKDEAKDVTDEQVNESIEKIFEQYKKIKAEDQKKASENVLEKKTEIVDVQGGSLIPSESEKIAMDDAFAQAAGAKDMEDLKTLVKSELKYESTTAVEKEYEDKVIKKMLELVEIDVPEMLVDEEVARIEERFKTQLERIGTSLENYLTVENKTLDDIKKEWSERALENTKVALILNEIKVQKDLPVSEEEIRMLAMQNGVKNQITEQQHTSIKYLIGQSKALQEAKKMAEVTQ